MPPYGESHLYFLKTQSFGFMCMGLVYIHMCAVCTLCQGLEKKFLELQTVINCQSRTWVLWKKTRSAAGPVVTAPPWPVAHAFNPSPQMAEAARF